MVQADAHLLTVCRYVERNALSAELVNDAGDWRWGSLWARVHGTDQQKSILCNWPLERPADWRQHVNTALTVKELERLQISIDRGRPFGDDRWVQRTTAQLGLESTVRARGGQSKNPVPQRETTRPPAK